jgi:hypothetical protein
LRKPIAVALQRCASANRRGVAAATRWVRACAARFVSADRFGAEAVYATADAANSLVLAELQLSADAADALKTNIYKQFARINELLRHFWHSHWRVAMAAKLARIVAALRISHDEIEQLSAWVVYVCV